jgi:hypothetical protein
LKRSNVLMLRRKKTRKKRKRKRKVGGHLLGVY